MNRLALHPRENSIMATQKVKSRRLQCPFCATISTRGTGLSSHIRSQHPREYRKWNKNPTKLADAAAAARAKGSADTALAQPVPSPPIDVTAGAKRRPQAQPRGDASALTVERGFGAADGNAAGALVQQAYDQLNARKQSIEAELGRIEALRAEHEAVASQVAALEEAMRAFQQPDQWQRKTA